MVTALLAFWTSVHAHELTAVVAASRDLADGMGENETAAFGVGPHLGLSAGLGPEESRAKLQVGLELQCGTGWIGSIRNKKFPDRPDLLRIPGWKSGTASCAQAGW